MKVRKLGGVLLAVLILGLVSGCGLFNKEPAAIGSLTLTDQVDERTKQALRPLTGYPATASQFYASVQVLNPQKGTKISARWLFEGMLVDEVPPITFDTNGDRFVAFNLVHKNNEPFPAGAYRVEIYLDGKAARALDFKVE